MRATSTAVLEGLKALSFNPDGLETTAIFRQPVVNKRVTFQPVARVERILNGALSWLGNEDIDNAECLRDAVIVKLDAD
jgi:hypothetical protein